ncbi:MAG: CRISPR-associated endonuclease Cas2 [Myxococcales bacterium]|nr:CRISPR-associated endonuclease Cas2 [Myxococcales bacterium]
MHTVIAFDISSDSARYRVFRILLEYATWVQRSVFESPSLDQAAYLRMRSRVERLVDPTTDSLRYYRMCAACAGRAEHHGVGPGLLRVPPPFRIV